MTPERKAQIQSLIASDAVAQGHFDAGRFGDCAVRLSEIAPPIPKRLQISQMGMLDLYRTNPMLGNLVLDALEQAALSNPVIRRMLPFMGPSTGPESLPDFSLAEIRRALCSPPELGGLGFTAEQAGPLLRAGEQKDIFTGRDIELLASEEI
jgi:hypothetical protein